MTGNRSAVAAPRVEAETEQHGGAVLLVILLLLAAAMAFGVYEWNKLSKDERYAMYANFTERVPPTAHFSKYPPGLGMTPLEFDLDVGDEGAGLDEVIVRVEQDGAAKDILRQEYPKPKWKDRLSFQLNAKTLGLREGDFFVDVSVFDRSFWSNGFKTSLPLRVDYKKPKLEVLSAQHNAVIGGTELAFYRVRDNDGGESGVEVGSHRFLGYPAHLLDPAFDTQPNVYFAFFAIPLDFDEDRDAVDIFAQNAVETKATVPFYYKAQKVRQITRQRDLEGSFLEGAVSDLYEKCAAVMESGPCREERPTAEQKFTAVNTAYRTVIERLVEEITGKPILKPFREGAFLRPVGTTSRADFGERRVFLYFKQPLGSAVNAGVDFASPGNGPVLAANSGEVIFSGDLGIYGNAIIVDHGFGLTSLYGHLLTTDVEKGALVKKGQPLGKAGQSGFAEEDRLRFELRVHGLPVRPIEWWDAHWVQDHVERKIEDIKKNLGLSTVSAAGQEEAPATGKAESSGEDAVHD